MKVRQIKEKQIREKQHMEKNNRNMLYIWVFLVFLAIGSLWGTYYALRENAHMLGTELASSYATEEARYISAYQTIVEIGMSYLEENLKDDPEPEVLEERLRRFFGWMEEAIEGEGILCYAFVGDQVISEEGFVLPEGYNHRETQWYEGVAGSEEDVVFTDAYESAVNGEQIVSVISMNKETGDIFGIDIDPESMAANHKSWKILENASYYLFDRNGNLLYHEAPYEVSRAGVENYARTITEEISKGEWETQGSAFNGDLNKRRRSVYYCQAENGWLSMVTVSPYVLYASMGKIFGVYILVFLIFLTVGAVWWRRNRKLSGVIRRTNDTIRVLGNSYYALYRVNVEQGTYEMIKGSDYVKAHIPHEGDYELLLGALVTVMDEEAGRDFARSFSLEHLRELADKGITDFGGDFRREFNGTYRWINVRLLADELLERGEMVLCFRRVDDEKQSQLQHIRLMEDALKAAEASEKSQIQFFSAMSHDMRTPLNAIIHMAQLAQREGCTETKRRDYLEKIDRSSKQLLTLINDILEMSRLEYGRVNLKVKSFDLCEELENCAAPFREQAGHEGKSFLLSMEVQNRRVCGDPFRLMQILNNLISNAVKFTRPGDEIRVKLRQTGGSQKNYLFVVEDTGIGMSEEFLPKLFEAYERERRFEAKEVIGTGLGMPIVKNLVSQMGGQIRVESVLGKGTRFFVSLPFQLGEEVSEKKEREVLPELLKGRRILLVDDNQLNLEIAAELLEEKGAKVQQACNGRAAVEAMASSAEFYFDAILMDMQMPEMDGCEATREIRKLEREDAKEIPIIALTANAFAEDIARTAQAGMNAHLSKPIDMELLCVTLHELLIKE